MSNAFRPAGVPAGRGARPSRTRSDYPRDRLAVVTGYDLSKGVMYATEMDTNLNLEVTVQRREGSSVSVATDTERKWQGNRIDSMMAEALPEDTWVILEGTRGTEMQMRGKQSVLPVAARWIINVSEPRPDKCFTGIFTLTQYQRNVDNIQAWEDKAISSQDQDALAAFGEELDAIHAAFMNRERPIRKGFQFRIIKQVAEATEGQNGRPGRPASYEVVDMSYPIDWIRPDNPSEDDIGAPPTRDQFSEYVNGYIDHIWGAEDGSTPPKFPEEELAKMQFEIATYRLFKAGDVQYNERMRIPDPEPGRYPSALYQLANTLTRYSEGEEYTSGKNWAVRGILQLINDSFDKKSNPPRVIPNYMARQLFTNGPRMNVHDFIATSDGGRAKVAKVLNRVLEESNRAPAAAPAPQGEPELSPPAGDQLEQPFGEGDFGSFLGDIGGDPFLGEGGTSAPAPAQSDAAAPAPAVLAEESSKNGQEAAAPAPASRPGRFQRSV